MEVVPGLDNSRQEQLDRLPMPSAPPSLEHIALGPITGGGAFSSSCFVKEAIPGWKGLIPQRWITGECDC